MRKLPLWLIVLSVLTRFGAGVAVADEAVVRCFLVDSRVHVAVVSAAAGHAGQLVWRDTVTGASGGAPFTTQGNRLLVADPVGGPVVARVLPDLAILLDHPPWARDRAGPSLGIALN